MLLSQFSSCQGFKTAVWSSLLVRVFVSVFVVVFYVTVPLCNTRENDISMPSCMNALLSFHSHVS